MTATACAAARRSTCHRKTDIIASRYVATLVALNAARAAHAQARM